MAANLGLRSAIRAITPGFLREGVGERVMYGMGLGSDAVLDKLTQGGNGRLPTRCSAGFLPILGSDRLIPRGLAESEDSYRLRLQRAFETWQLAGSARSTLSQVLGYLSGFTLQAREVSTRYTPDPARIPVQVAQGMGTRIIGATFAAPIVVTTETAHGFTTGDVVFIVGDAGVTNTNANGYKTITVTGVFTFTLSAPNGNGSVFTGTVQVVPATYPPDRLDSRWDTYPEGRDPTTEPVHQVSTGPGTNGDFNWDSDTQEIFSWAPGGGFLVLYAPASGGWTEPPTWAIGDTSLTIATLPGSIGLSVDADVIDGIRSIAALFKSADTIIRWIIVSFDPVLFDPDQPDGGGINPDGTFGQWHELDSNEWIASRFADAAFCDGTE